MNNSDKWQEKLNDDIVALYDGDPGFKICIVSQSSSKAEDLMRTLSGKYPHLKSLRLVGSDSGETKKQLFENINETLADVNIFIYSPVIESGVDITIPIDKVYGVLSAKSNSERAYLQMLARCRNVKDREVLILNDKQFGINRNYQFWKYSDIVASNSDSLKISYMDMTLDGNDITVRTKEDLKRKQISIFNTVERLNKNPVIYLNYLRVLAVEKGYNFVVDEEKPVRRKQEKINYRIEAILAAEEIDDMEYDRLKALRAAGKTTSEENHAVEKKYWKRFLLCNELDKDLLKAYLYGDVFNNFLGLIDTRNHRKVDTVESDKFVEKVALVQSIIQDVGFTSILDDTAVEGYDLVGCFHSKIVNGSYNMQRINELFGFTKINKVDVNMTIKHIMGWLNVILRQYSLGITITRKSIRKGGKIHKHTMYKLEVLNDIVDLMKRRNQTCGAMYYDGQKMLHLIERNEIDISFEDPFLD